MDEVHTWYVDTLGISIVLCGGKWSFEGRAPKTESYAGEDNFKTKGQTLNLVCWLISLRTITRHSFWMQSSNNQLITMENIIYNH